MTTQDAASITRLASDVERSMLTDRHRLRQKLRTVERRQRARQPFDRALRALEEELRRSLQNRDRRETALPAVTLDEELPIAAKRDEIAAALKAHQVIVVSGETGSGKSTQLPLICLQQGLGIAGKIGHTQPRRIAARSVAARIAEELGTPVGTAVGFKIRFTDATSAETYVKLMTDGILLAETQSDRHLNEYDTIIIDEAHERSLNIDFLLGYLKRLLPQRPELKVIVTSATIDAERFAEHFATSSGPAPILEVSGRTYPVDVLYRPIESGEEQREPDWQRAVVDAVEELAARDHGDMLIFMPTERDIRDVARLIRGRNLTGDAPPRRTEVLPLYGRLSTAEQNRVFQPHPHRRIVIATNVAESSLTVPGIRYVIDPGTARISRYSARSKVQRLPVEPISRASADQRMGRCGRVGPGVCIRLYSESDYLSRERFTQPEMLRTNLAAVILQTEALRLGNLEEFPFLDPPKPANIRAGYKALFELGAFDADNHLTDIGRTLSRLPVDPRIGRMILAGHEEQCLAEVLIIAAALEVQDPRLRPVEQQQSADEAHAKFRHPDSDFLTYIKIWDAYHHWKESLSRNRLRKACEQNFLSYNRLREWADVYRQLREIVAQHGMRPAQRRDDFDSIHRALLTGLLSNVALRGEQNEYLGAGGNKFHLWPGSALFAKPPKWLMAAELVETGRRYARTIARINPDWIEPLAPHLVTRTYSDPHWDRKRAATMAFEKVSLFGLPIVPRRRMNYGRIDAAASRDFFIREGLVGGEFDSPAEFLAHNRLFLEELEQRQAKLRQVDIVPTEEALQQFYEDRIPADVYDGKRFERWRKRAERKQPRLLFMTADEVAVEPMAAGTGEFPNAVRIDDMRLPLEYKLEPGTQDDGVTLTVPVEALNRLDRGRLGWLVPGLLEEKVTAMIRSLPKPLRRFFVPAPETAKEVLKRLQFGQGDFEAAVAQALRQISGERVTPQDFDIERLPRHLQMNICVTGADGTPLTSGRDPDELQRELASEARAGLEAEQHGPWNRDGVRQWDWDQLPQQVDINRGGVTLKAYPAVIDAGSDVSLRLRDDLPTALLLTRGGLVRLFAIHADTALQQQVRHLPQLNRMRLLASTLPDGSEFARHIADRIAERAFWTEAKVPRSAADFQQRTQLARNQISVAVQDVAKLLPAVMDAYQEVRVALERKYPPVYRSAIADIRRQFARLIEPGFLARVPWDWLRQYPRYFRAILLRLEKLPAGPQRDEHNQQLVQRFEQQYLACLADHQHRNLIDPQLEIFRWMIEELRVSLFAQQLRTIIPISPQRLQEQWSKVRR